MSEGAAYRRAQVLVHDLLSCGTNDEFHYKYNPDLPPGTALPAAVARPREWLIDSGSAFNILGARGLEHNERCNVRPCEDDVVMSTANGPACAKGTLDVTIGGPFEDFEGPLRLSPIVMDESPHVLSLGRLIRKHGCSFEWSTGVGAVLRTRDGTKVKLEVKDDVPVMTEYPWWEEDTRANDAARAECGMRKSYPDDEEESEEDDPSDEGSDDEEESEEDDPSDEERSPRPISSRISAAAAAAAARRAAEQERPDLYFLDFDNVYCPRWVSNREKTCWADMTIEEQGIDPFPEQR